MYSQNANGLFDKETGLNTAFHQLQSVETSIFCLQETHQDKLNQLSSQSCSKTKKDVWDNQGCPCYIETSSTLEKVKYTVKPDGTMVGVSGKLVGRVQKRYSDWSGQWIGMTLVGKDGREILVVSVYNDSQKMDSGIGPNTLYKQKQSAYMKEYNNLKRKNKHKNTNHTKYIDPQYRFYTGLTEFISEHLEQKSDVILTGDFNDEIGTKYDELTRIIENLGLVDVFAFQNGFETEVPTYNRGSRNLEYTFVTIRILDNVKACGYNKYNDFIPSDHRGLFLDLSVPGLFRRDIPTICTLSWL